MTTQPINAEQDARIIETAISDAQAHAAQGLVDPISDATCLVMFHFFLDEHYATQQERWEAIYRIAYNDALIQK